MQVSLIIPTYRRVKDLDECLDSIIAQTKLPKEVIIVDDSESNEIENLIEYRKDEFKEKSILLRYIKNERERSLTIARNIGIENAAGDIVLFLDSDVVLDVKYIEEILRVYKEKPYALGVQGLIQGVKKEERRTCFRNILGRLYFTSSFNEKNKCRVFPSLTVSYPDPSLDEIINCEWLSGANQSYKKEILEEFRWDENLKKYSGGEDLDLPYRIFKKYPSSLFTTPHAKLIHKASQEGRHLRREVIYMDVIYLTYLFYKNIDQSIKNKLIYLRSRIGRIIFNIIVLIFKSKSKLTEIKYVLGAHFYCMRHIGEIKKGDLEFFNKGLR
jgi:GT2 family glycosyltransferase